MYAIRLCCKKRSFMKHQEIEGLLTQYPLYQYAIISSEQVPFSDKVRTICETECERYGQSWSCPPAVGTVEECREKCASYDHVLLFSTVAEVADTYDFASRLATRKEHEEITGQIETLIKGLKGHTLTLSSDSCSICDSCAYPAEKCRHKDQMRPCIESYGIVLMPLLEQLEFDYSLSENLILWFSMIFFS